MIALTVVFCLIGFEFSAFWFDMARLVTIITCYLFFRDVVIGHFVFLKTLDFGDVIYVRVTALFLIIVQY